MFTKSKAKKRRKTHVHIDTLVGQQTHLKGDVEFSGGLRVDGKITGKINAINDIESMLTLSELGQIDGEVRVPNMMINGQINGDIYAVGHLELADKAKITGNVFYRLIEMAVGAEVNGQLIRMSADENTQQSLPNDSEQTAQLEQQPKS